MLMIGNHLTVSVYADNPITRALCYFKCNELCLIDPRYLLNSEKCAKKCVKECHLPGYVIQDTINQIDYFCQVGCVNRRCALTENQSKFSLTFILADNELVYIFLCDINIIFYLYIYISLMFLWLCFMDRYGESCGLCEFMFRNL